MRSAGELGDAHPVWIASSSSAWSRRPSQVRSVGRGEQRIDLVAVEVADGVALMAFGAGSSITRAIVCACSGWRSAA